MDTSQATNRLPTHLDLPETDGLPVDNVFQPAQWALLFDSLRPHLLKLHPDGPFLLAMDHGIYFRITDPPLNGCRCPDLLYVPGVPQCLPDSLVRRSYVLWQEKIPPTLVVELVSEQSRGSEHDRTPQEGKFWIYENAIKAKYYVIYDVFSVTLEVYALKDGKYELVAPDEDGLFPLPLMKVRMGTLYGEFGGETTNWLRFFDEDGELLETNGEKLDDEQARRRREFIRANREQQRADQAAQLAKHEFERAEQEKHRAEQEKQRAEQEKQRAEQLAAKLRELGVDPEKI